MLQMSVGDEAAGVEIPVTKKMETDVVTEGVVARIIYCC